MQIRARALSEIGTRHFRTAPSSAIDALHPDTSFADSTFQWAAGDKRSDADPATWRYMGDNVEISEYDFRRFSVVSPLGTSEHINGYVRIFPCNVSTDQI